MKNIRGLLMRQPGQVELSSNLESELNFVPGKDELLIELKFAPVNPIDFILFHGLLMEKKAFPCVPGSEGFGVVVQAGDDAHKHLVGKPCTVLLLTGAHGTYASHTIGHVGTTVILDELPNPESFEYLINPLTALGLLEKAKEHGATALVQNGASSSVAKLILFYNSRCKKLPSINIVRNISHKAELESLGATEVLSSADPDYLPKLEAAIAKYKPNAAFDALAGKSTGELFNRLPYGAWQWLYGTMELKPVEGLEGQQIIFTGKELKGFTLVASFIKDKDLSTFAPQINDASKHFKQAAGVKAFALDTLDQAFKYFPQRKEKVVFKCTEPPK